MDTILEVFLNYSLIQITNKLGNIALSVSLI